MDSPAPGGLTPFPDHCHCGIRWLWRRTFFLGLSLGELFLLWTHHTCGDRYVCCNCWPSSQSCASGQASTWSCCSLTQFWSGSSLIPVLYSYIISWRCMVCWPLDTLANTLSPFPQGAGPQNAWFTYKHPSPLEHANTYMLVYEYTYTTKKHTHRQTCMNTSEIYVHTYIPVWTHK